jgi:hypothetical protein
MFRSRRVSVQPGDVFIEAPVNKKRMSISLGELHSASQENVQSQWTVSALTTFNELPHARLTNEATGRVRTISIASLERQEIYKKAN